MFLSVDRLHETTHATLRKVLQRGTVLALPRVNGAAALRIDLAVLLARLPLHVMACLLAQQPQPAAQGATYPVANSSAQPTQRRLQLQFCCAKALPGSPWRSRLKSVHTLLCHADVHVPLAGLPRA